MFSYFVAQVLGVETKITNSCPFSRWAAEQAKARELGDVVDFVRDLNLEKEKEHHVTS